MDKIEKFIRALDLMNVEGRYQLGLATNYSGNAFDWKLALNRDFSLVEVTDDKFEADIIMEIKKALIGDKWVVLDLKTDITVELYNQIRLLALSNRLQILKVGTEEIIKMGEKSRLIVTGINEIITKVCGRFPEFKKLFGLAVDI